MNQDMYDVTCHFMQMFRNQSSKEWLWEEFDVSQGKYPTIEELTGNIPWDRYKTTVGNCRPEKNKYPVDKDGKMQLFKRKKGSTTSASSSSFGINDVDVRSLADARLGLNNVVSINFVRVVPNGKEIKMKTLVLDTHGKETILDTNIASILEESATQNEDKHLRKLFRLHRTEKEDGLDESHFIVKFNDRILGKNAFLKTTIWALRTPVSCNNRITTVVVSVKKGEDDDDEDDWSFTS